MKFLFHFVSLHKNLNKLSFLIIFEISIIFLFTIFVGLSFKSLSFDDTFSFLYIVLLIVSLYYGIVAGIILDLMYILFCYLYYLKFPFAFSINSLMLVIVAGEFHFYYRLKISSLEEQVKYLESRLREIGRGALFTKLSHDYLEESYLSKPYSLRSLIIELSNKKEIDEFLEFLKNKFHLKKFVYVENKDLYKIGVEDVNLKDVLVEEMYEKKDIVFFKEAKGEYLASIPIFDLEDEIKAFILIKEMPFIHYSEENLLAIQLVANYFYLRKLEAKMLDSLKDDKFCKVLSCKVLKNIKELFRLYQISNVKSSLILFEIDDLKSDILDNFLKENLRALDFFEKKDNKFLVVLPFTNKVGGKYFVKRVMEVLDLKEKNRYNVFEIKDYKKVLKLIDE